MQESYNPQSFSRFFFFLCFLFTATMSLLAQDVNKPALPTATSASDKRESDSLKFYGRFGPRNKTRDSLSKNVGYGTGSPNGKKAASSIHNDATPAVITIKEPEIVMVLGGMFQMGCTNEQGGDCLESEKPVHEVGLHIFFMGKYEITVGQYLEFCQETNAHLPEWLEKDNETNVETGKSEVYKRLGYRRQGTENLPIVGVRWDDAVAYCAWLSKKTNKNYRLPTEAEWEYAARGGNVSKGYKYSGSNTIDDVAWYGGNAQDKPHNVGQKKANELGIYDMSGNVLEWCSDYFSAYTSQTVVDPIGEKQSTSRVLRGGSWYTTSPENCRVSHRGSTSPIRRNTFALGFRIVLIP